jgi:hypothetical protein
VANVPVTVCEEVGGGGSAQSASRSLRETYDLWMRMCQDMGTSREKCAQMFAAEATRRR